MTTENFTVRNVLAACKNIDKLTNSGYNFLYQCGGFIAHYNIGGFKVHYSTHSLKQDILRNEPANRYENFKPGDKDYGYYMNRRNMYQQIIKKLKEEL